jgi:hypothetical protein
MKMNMKMKVQENHYEAPRLTLSHSRISNSHSNLQPTKYRISNYLPSLLVVVVYVSTLRWSTTNMPTPALKYPVSQGSAGYLTLSLLSLGIVRYRRKARSCMYLEHARPMMLRHQARSEFHISSRMIYQRRRKTCERGLIEVRVRFSSSISTVVVCSSGRAAPPSLSLCHFGVGSSREHTHMSITRSTSLLLVVSVQYWEQYR